MSQISTMHEPESSPLSADVNAAALAFLPDATEIAAVRGHPRLARVSAPSGIWRVRQWPQGTAASDIIAVHEVMEAAKSAGLPLVPALLAPDGAPEGTILRQGPRFFDAQRWLPGEPPARAESWWPEPDGRIDLPVALPLATFDETIEFLAQLHEGTIDRISAPDIPTAPLQHLPGAVRQAQARHLGALRPRSRFEPSIQRWLATGERLLAMAEPLVLEAAVAREASRRILHLGLWPAHLLIDDSTMSGVLGWERAAIGDPLLDVAQAILRLQGWSDESAERALGTYSDIRRLNPEDRRLLPAIAAIDAVATTGRLLELTYAAGTSARPPSALRNGIDMMLRSMTALDRNLNAPSDKSRRRTWVRKGPPPGASARPQGGRPRARRR